MSEAHQIQLCGFQSVICRYTPIQYSSLQALNFLKHADRPINASLSFFLDYLLLKNMLTTVVFFSSIFRGFFLGFTTSLALMALITIYFASMLLKLDGWNWLYIIGLVEVGFFGMVATFLSLTAVSI